MIYGESFEVVMVNELHDVIIIAHIFEQTPKFWFINIVIYIYLGFVWETGFPECYPYVRPTVRLSQFSETEYFYGKYTKFAYVFVIYSCMLSIVFTIIASTQYILLLVPNNICVVFCLLVKTNNSR